jgi:hypothetical protein
MPALTDVEIPPPPHATKLVPLGSEATALSAGPLVNAQVMPALADTATPLK